MMNSRRIGIIGVGHVGLQTAIAFSKAGLSHPNFEVLGYDQNKKRIEELNNDFDSNQEAFHFKEANLKFTSDLQELTRANYFIISIPTSINEHLTPIINPLKTAAMTIAQVLKKNDVVILESTVYPGATRNLLIPILEEQSKLKSGQDFFVGFSSERINLGEKIPPSCPIWRVISAQTPKALKKIKGLYRCIPNIKIYEAPSLEVAESSKLLENIQRDLNIALMNEFAQVMEKINISIHDVLEAAQTKWNFLPFKPGFVGGHCIPEDPYYLIYQANKLGIFTNLITRARQVNEQFVDFIRDISIKLLAHQGMSLKSAKVAILGASFKENVNDIRHSLSIVLGKKLQELGMKVVLCDPLANQDLKDLIWVDIDQLKNCKCIIFAKEHNAFLKIRTKDYNKKMSKKAVFIDIPGTFIKEKDSFRPDIAYWSL